MKTPMRAVFSGLVAAALALAPLSAALADHHGRSGGHGEFRHFGLGGVLVGAVVGLVTLPLQIVAAVADPRRYDDTPARPYYPDRGYAYPRGYAYGPSDRSYGPPQGGYEPARPVYPPRSGYYEGPREYPYQYRRYDDYPR